MRLLQSIKQVFSSYRERPAVSRYMSDNRLHTLTYGQVEEEAAGLGRCLTERGMRTGDMVVTYMNKSPELVVALFSTVLHGGTACCLNPRLKPHHVLDLAARANARVILLDESASNCVMRMQERNAPEQVKLCPETPQSLDIPSSNGTQSLRLWECRWDERSNRGLSADDSPSTDNRAYCLFTSGSTGAQKGVLISRDDLLRRADTEREDYDLRETDCLLSVLPFSFDVGLNQLISSFLSGAHLVILNSWFPGDILSAVRSVGVTGISGVPSIWSDMTSYAKGPRFDEEIRTLRYVTVSGGDLPQSHLVRLRQYFGKVRIYKTYGQTETFRSSILGPDEYERKMTSVGRPVKGTRVFIIDRKGEIVPPGTEGEIVHYGSGTMLGYMNDPSATQEKLKDIPESLKGSLPGGKVVYTGDCGKIDEEGYLYLLGREDGMIKTLGYRVYPKEVENCILEHEQVKNAAVVGVTDGRKGQVIVTEVVAKGSLDKKELLTYLRKRLPYYMVPDDIHIVERLPMTESAKIKYAEIKERHEERRFLYSHP
jgi:acyl-coenzyme A synthetase/AMP-(fatty) acid ligase